MHFKVNCLKKSKYMGLSLLLPLLVIAFPISPVRAATVEVFVGPAVAHATQGDIVTVNIRVSDIQDLAGYNQRVRFNNQVLRLLACDQSGNVFQGLPTFRVAPCILDSPNVVQAAEATFGVSVDVRRGANLFALTFEVIAMSSSVIDILGDRGEIATPLVRVLQTTTDGLVTTASTRIEFIGKGQNTQPDSWDMSEQGSSVTPTLIAKARVRISGDFSLVARFLLVSRSTGDIFVATSPVTMVTPAMLPPGEIQIVIDLSETVNLPSIADGYLLFVQLYVGIDLADQVVEGGQIIGSQVFTQIDAGTDDFTVRA